MIARTIETLSKFPSRYVHGTSIKFDEEFNTFKSKFPGASLTGCTATVKTTAVTGLMSWTRIVLPVLRRVTGSARTGGASPRGGSATSRTTAGTTLMRARRCAREGTGSARNRSSPATTGSASRQGKLILSLLLCF